MQKTRFAAALGLVIGVALLTGCASPARVAPAPEAPSAADLVPLGELTVLADPRGYVGASTAVLAAASADPVALDAAPALPTTVTSHDLDGDIRVDVATADRILGLDIAGSIGSTLFGLGAGDRVVGRDTSTTLAAAVELPLVTTGGHSINSEAVIALRPDLVITDGTVGPIDVVLQLRDAGITVVFVDTEPSLDGIGELTRQVAAAIGAPEAGETLATRLAEDIAATVAEIDAIAPAATGDRLRMLFLYLRGTSGIYYLFGEESGADVLIESLGGIDVAGEIGWSGMKPMTDEALVAANPDLILVMTDGLASAGGVDGLLESKPAIALTRAGQNKRFVDMADGDILSFGPRTADVLDALARAIYAPQ